MVESVTYLVSESIAERSGLIDSRYRVQDGRYVLNSRDLRQIRFTAEEIISGLDGVEKISSAMAKDLIRKNKYARGRSSSAIVTVANGTHSEEEEEDLSPENFNEETESSEAESEEQDEDTTNNNQEEL